MTSPVMLALARQTLAQLEPNNAAIAQEVTRILGQPAPVHVDLHPVFVSWMQNHGLPAFPASPEAIALFVLNSKLPLETLCEITRGISEAHANTVDPTASWAVRTAFVVSFGKLIPRWTDEMKLVSELLPYHLQQYLIERDRKISEATRRAQNQAAALREQLCRDAGPEAALQAEFSDIRTLEAVAKLEANDPARFRRWQKLQKQINAAKAAETENRHAEKTEPTPEAA